jgi:hypothetical protein
MTGVPERTLRDWVRAGAVPLARRRRPMQVDAVGLAAVRARG